MRDPRARKDMVPDEVWAKMPPDPEILALEAETAHSRAADSFGTTRPTAGKGSSSKKQVTSSGRPPSRTSRTIDQNLA
jgi:hypothetical protein